MNKEQRHEIYLKTYERVHEHYNDGIGTFSCWQMGVVMGIDWRTIDVNKDFPELALFKEEPHLSAIWATDYESMKERLIGLAFCIAMTE